VDGTTLRAGCAALLLMAVGLVGGGCTVIDQEPPPEVRADPIHEDLFPDYVELCATSQWRRQDGVVGGVPGHTVMYLKGACRRPGAAYPTVEMCPNPSDDPESLDHGVGISVNKIFRSVNWMATPGKDLFFDGGLDPGETLTAARQEAYLDRLVDLGLFDGIEIHPQYLDGKPESLPMSRFIAEEAVGTDFALRYARSSFCTRVPVERSMMVEIVDWLNALNADYADGETEYNWNGYNDNCVHMVRNSLAAADIWTPKLVGTIRIRQLFNMAVPANEFVNLAERVTQFPVEDEVLVRRDDAARRSLARHDWLPSQPGALLEILPPHPDNEIYETGLRLFVMEGPLSERREVADRLLRDARFRDLEANLRYWRDVYARVVAERPRRNDAFAADYKALAEEQVAEIDEKLRRLSTADDWTTSSRRVDGEPRRYFANGSRTRSR
jgi:hypothetical protein